MYRHVKRVGVSVVGSLVILAGVIMLFTPGQGILAILLGLAILGTEFHWAKRAHVAIRERAVKTAKKVISRDTTEKSD